MNNDDDPTTRRARERSRLGLPRDPQQVRTTHDTIPTSGSKGVPVHLRQSCVEYAVAHNVEAAARSYPYSKASIHRWMNRIDPYQMTGNKERSILVGRDPFLLVMSVYLYPRADADERAAFIFANGGSQAYSRQDIYRRLSELNVSRKKCGLEAHRAFAPDNILKYRLFCEFPYQMKL